MSLDDLRAELDVDPDDAQAHVIAAAREQARRYRRAGTSFAWNATNLSEALCGQLLALFRSYRARTYIVYCEATASEHRERNRARAQPVPVAVIDRMLGRWTVPDPSEAHAVTHVVSTGAGDPAWPLTAPRGDDGDHVVEHVADLDAFGAGGVEQGGEAGPGEQLDVLGVVILVRGHGGDHEPPGDAQGFGGRACTTSCSR